jgi:hypothetical protein
MIHTNVIDLGAAQMPSVDYDRARELGYTGPPFDPGAITKWEDDNRAKIDTALHEKTMHEIDAELDREEADPPVPPDETRDDPEMIELKQAHRIRKAIEKGDTIQLPPSGYGAGARQQIKRIRREARQNERNLDRALSLGLPKKEAAWDKRSREITARRETEVAKAKSECTLAIENAIELERDAREQLGDRPTLEKLEAMHA